MGLVSSPCLVLLGPPGMGKTTEIQQMYEDEVGPKHFVDLAEVTSSGDIERLLDAEPIQAWSRREAQLSLFLDAFDEGRADVGPLAATLARVLKNLGPADALRVRIACRDADRPRSLESALGDHLGSVEALTLAPLRKPDAWQIAAQTLGQQGADAFIKEVLKADLGVLASAPLTLKQLVGVYQSQGGLPESRVNLFREAVLLHVEETNEGRREAGRVGRLDPADRIRLASRVAALLRFSGRTHLHVGLRSEAEPGALTVDEVVGEADAGTAWAGTVPLTAALADLVRHSGLFVGGPDRFRIVHLSYEEFLAAEHLRYERTAPDAVFAILSHPEAGIRPQLRETAAWVAASDPEFRGRVLTEDPEVALRYAAAALTDETKKQAVERFLEAHDRRAIGFWDRLPDPLALAHPGLDDQLIRWARNRSHFHAARKAAVATAMDAERTGFASTAVDLVLDGSESPELRHLAALAALKLGGDAGLRRIAHLADPKDDDDRWIAFAVRRALFPKDLSFGRLAAMLEADAEHAVRGARSAAERFASEVVLDGDLPRNVLLDAVTWVAGQSSFGLTARPVADAIATAAAERSPQDVEVARALARAVIGPGPKVAYSTEFEWPREATRRPEVRRAIVAGAVEVLAERDPGLNISDLRLGALVHGHGLLETEDMEWVLEQLRAASAPGSRSVWAAIVWNLYNGGSHVEALLSACAALPTIWELFPLYLGYFTAVDIEGPIADELRAREQQAAERRAEQERKQAEARPDPPTPAEVSLAVRRVLDGAPRAWADVCSHLARSPEDNRRPRWYFHDDLESALTWTVLSQSQRDGVAEAATAFLGATPAECNGIGPRFSVMALRILYEHVPDSFDDLDETVWVNHAAAVVSAPFRSNATEYVDRRADFLERAYREAPDEVVAALDRAVSEEYDSAPTIVYAATRFWDDRMRQALVDAICSRPHGDPWPARESVLRVLLERKSQEATEAVVAGLRDHLQSVEASSEVALWYASHAFKAVPAEAWPLLSGQVLRDDEFAEAFLRRLSIDARHTLPADAPPDILATLYRRLYEVRPESEDPPRPDGMYTWDTDHGLYDLRNGFLNALVNQGTQEAVAAVERLAASPPSGVDLAYSVRNAREQWVRNDPAFLAPSEVLRASRDPDATPIRSDRELQAATLRALDLLQSELTGQPQASSPDLWNTLSRDLGGARPKSEVEVSDYVARHLQRSLGRRGVVVTRESEVYAGSETDILLSLSLDQGRQALVVAEVKGAWNDGAVLDLRRQLANRYLAQAGRRHGVHLVASFEGTRWDADDSRRGKRPDPDALFDALQREAELAALDGYDVVPRVLRIRAHRGTQPTS